MKRYIKRWISFILFMCVFVQYPSEGVVMAADSDQKNIQIVGTASMNTYDVALRVGKTKQLVCNGTTGKMVWKSSNPKVATVDKKGLVKAIKPGKAMISVSGGNLIGSMTCKVGVSKKITTKQARRKIMAMKKTYKEGLSWTNENRQYFWEATNCQCYGCIALCGEISDKVFGKYAPGQNTAISAGSRQAIISASETNIPLWFSRRTEIRLRSWKETIMPPFTGEEK